MRMRIGFFLAAMVLIWLVLARTGDTHAGDGGSPDSVMAATAS